MTKLTFNKIHRNNKKIIRCEKPKKDSINGIDYVKIELKKYIEYIHYDKTKDELEYEFNNFKYPNLIHIKNINSPKINLHPNMIFRICAYKDSIPSNAKYINTISRGVDYGESSNSNFNNCTGIVYGYSYWIESKYELAFNYRIIEDELITNNSSNSHLFSHNQFINYYTDELNNEDSQYNFNDFDDFDDYETFIKSTQDKKVWYSEYNEEEDIYNNYDYDYEYVTYEDYNRIDYNTDTESDSEYNSDLTDTEDMTDYDST
jgi:hypothetical protein